MGGGKDREEGTLPELAEADGGRGRWKVVEGRGGGGWRLGHPARRCYIRERMTRQVKTDGYVVYLFINYICPVCVPGECRQEEFIEYNIGAMT